MITQRNYLLIKQFYINDQINRYNFSIQTFVFLKNHLKKQILKNNDRIHMNFMTC